MMTNFTNEEMQELLKDLNRWFAGDRDALKSWRDRWPQTDYDQDGYFFDHQEGRWLPWLTKRLPESGEDDTSFFIHQDGEPTRYPFNFEDMPTAEELADRLHLPLETAQRILVRLSGQLAEPSAFNDQTRLNALERQLVLIDLARFICYCEDETDDAIARMPMETLFFKAEIWSRRNPESRIQPQNGVHFSSS